MNIENMKNIVVLKDLPSNMVEEAIVILKPNIKLQNIKTREKAKENIKVGAKGKERSREYIIKEAESIVTQYISNLERPKQLEVNNRKLIVKYNRIRIVSILLGMIGIFGIVINFL